MKSTRTVGSEVPISILFEKTRVLFYSVVPSPYQRDLFLALSQHPNIELTVLYLEPASPDSPWPDRPLQSYESILPGFWVAWGQSRFHFNWHWPNFNHYDAIVLNGYQNSLAQLLARRIPDHIPLIFWGEQLQEQFGGVKGFVQKLTSRVLRRCDAIVAIGSKAQADYQKRFPDKPIFNIPYYCDLTPFQKNIPNRPRYPITILFCGQMIYRKGIDLLLSAFDELIQQGYTARLLLVGRQADLPKMLKSVQKITLKHIEYVGFQPPDRLPQFFQKADLFILPSRYDGWGVVVNQALGAGLPIICSDRVMSSFDLIKTGLNGFQITCTKDSIKLSLSKYLVNPNLLEIAANSSRTQSLEWTPQVGASNWFEAITNIVRVKT